MVDRVAEARLELMPTPGASRLVDRLPPRSWVNVSASPTRSLQATLDLATRLHDQGHRTIPHLAARMVEGPVHVARIAAWAARHDVTDVFVIAGDAREPRGPYPDAISLARALLEANPAHVARIGFGGYPDGHPSIPAAALDAALADKQAMLEEAGIGGWVSTQMCFDPDATVAWLVRQRRAGLRLPVHLGIPGAVNVAKLLATGLRLGIGASLRYLRANRSTLSRLAVARRYDPTPLLGALVSACEPLDVPALHVFTFNQVAATVEWQRQVRRELAD